MIRVKRIMALCLAAVFLVTLTVYAAPLKHWFTYKVRQQGTVMDIQTWECFVDQKNQKSAKHEVRLEYLYGHDRFAKTVYKRDYHTYRKIGTRKGNYKYYAYFPYRINMNNCKPGKYRLELNCKTTDFYINRVINFTYSGAPVLNYSSTKVIRNNNGELVQRFYFKRANTNGKMFHAQIFNGKNKLVRSFNFKAGNSNQPLAFNWNGWPGGNSARRCPKGTYTIKYWIDGLSPRTAKFRLAF